MWLNIENIYKSGELLLMCKEDNGGVVKIVDMLEFFTKMEILEIKLNFYITTHISKICTLF